MAKTKAKLTTKDENEAKKEETKEETMTEESSMPEESTIPEESTMPESTTLAKVEGTSLASLVGAGNEKFMAEYGKQVERVASNLPTPLLFQKIIDSMPDDIADKICEITKKIGGEMQGMYSNDDRPDFPELRVFHGVGNDPNRPDKQIPGEMYLTSNENAGEKFTGTVLAIWEGRTMWGDTSEGDSVRMPICQSMDRKQGSAYGDCTTCPNRPWKDGVEQRCSNDVVAYMLTRDLTEIVKVRFSKTSEPAGKQLIRLLKRDRALWMRWYTISTEQKTSAKDSSRRWYVMHVEKTGGPDPYTPETIHEFCSNMCTSLEAAFILPSLANVYRQAQQATGDATSDEGASSGVLSAEDAENSDYGSMEDAPEDNN